MKRVFIATLFLVASVSMIACGKDKAEKEADKMIAEIEEEAGEKLDKESKEAIKDMAMAMNEEDADEKAEGSDKAEASSEYELFPKSSEWDNTKFEDFLIQIDDVCIAPGAKTEDVMSKIEQSSVNYDLSGYNPDKLLTNKEDEKIVVLRDNKEWIIIRAENRSADKETHAVKDCPVVYISPSEEAQKYSYLLNGKSYDELSAMSYDELKSYTNEVFTDPFEFTETTKDGKISLFYQPRFGEFASIPNSQWTGVDLKGNYQYSFYVDPDTGKMAGYKIECTGTEGKPLE